MLDHVERRGFLVEPAGKGPVPPPIGLLDVELDEGPRQLLWFPRSGGLAGAQANDHVLPADGLAGMESDVLNDPVALVEDPEDRDALRHRRDPALAVRRRGRLLAPRKRGILLLGTLAARGERECGEQDCSEVAHAYSGIQGS